MKSLKRPLFLVSTLIVVSLLVSWNLFDDHRIPTTFELTTNDKISPQTKRPPAAEDVLIQRIPGDNGHVFLMAYYSRENYFQPSFTIENGFTITFRDDGKGDDKIAGDGLYTAKIPADLAGFRAQALGLVQTMKAGRFEPISYLNRQIIVDPNAAESFDIKKFEANEPVSVSGLNNALSADAKPTGPNAAAVPSVDAIKKNSLVITDLKVVEDKTRTYNPCASTPALQGNPNGPWTFGTLIRNLATKNSAKVVTDAALSDFVKKWLVQFATPQTVNGETVPARPLLNSELLDPWLAKSQAAGSPAGQLDMKFAPFRLTAITNRFDLRDGQAFGNSGQPCGEARFIFSLINKECTQALLMTVIFEARVNTKNKCDDKRAWAQQWANLANFTLGSPEYNTALQTITDQFAGVGNTSNAPNQNALSQLRTNEVALESLVPGQGTWQLREFNLVNNGNTQSNGKGKVDLKMGTVKQAPTDKTNGALLGSARPLPFTVTEADVKRSVDFVNQNTNAINSGFYTVPEKIGGSSFLGAVSRVEGVPVKGFPFFDPTLIPYHWNGNGSATITDDEARFNFSLQTCSGCHAGEAQTFFTHVGNQFFGTEAVLSGFVAGKATQFGVADADGNPNNNVFSVVDPASRPSGNPKSRPFNDLQRRATDLHNFVSTSCGSVLAISSELMFQPLNSAD